MDVDDALPPAIRRSPRAALEAQKQYRDHRTYVFDESDEDLDEAAPPPIARSRSASLDGEATSRPATSSGVNPLRSPDWFTLEDDPPTNPPPSIMSKPSSMHSSSGSSRRTSTPVETPLEYGSLDHHTPQSLFRKMMPRRLTDKTPDPPPSPTRLVIAKSTSVDRTSAHISNFSRSTTSLSEEQRSMPEERSLQSILDNVERSRSGSKSSGSSKWSASDFDTSTLTEAELKKCHKKGINPALYAEMRAAKKGKWTSPIAGNTFL